MKESCSLRVVNMARPQRTIRSNVLKNALKSFVVPVFSRHYCVCAFRALWEVKASDLHLAELNIWYKRAELEEMLFNYEGVIGFFSCITAVLKEKKKGTKRKANETSEDSDNDSNDEGEVKTIPGIRF